MRYHVTLGDRTFEVDLSGEEPTVDGKAVRAELTAVPATPVRHLLVDGRSYPLVARTGEARGQWRLHLAGRGIEAEVIDERTRAIREMTGAAAAATGPKPIRAPMPGLVVRVEVEAGQAVQAGDGVVIVEAMKMENELKADAPGVVSKVRVEAGDAVEKGTILVEFEADTSG